MDNLNLPDDRRRIGRDEQTVDVVDDQLVAAWPNEATRGEEGRVSSALELEIRLSSLPHGCDRLGLTVRSERRSDDLGQLSDSLDVTEDGLLETGQVLRERKITRRETKSRAQRQHAGRGPSLVAGTRDVP